MSEEEELKELLNKADAGTRAAFTSATVARYGFKGLLEKARVFLEKQTVWLFLNIAPSLFLLLDC